MSTPSLSRLPEWTPEETETYLASSFQASDYAELNAAFRAAGFVEPARALEARGLTLEHGGVDLLSGVSVAVPPGRMVAVVGDPAAVTPLLELVAGVRPGAAHEHRGGSVLLDGRAPGGGVRRAIGYLPAEDLHMPTLTVRETLAFSAALRMPAAAPAHLRVLRVEAVLRVLGIDGVADSIVGDSVIRGISGGEKRRLSIGVGLVAGHSVLVADLPTNGLDASTAHRLVSSLRATAAASGSSFVFSLGQCSPQLLAEFDELLVVSASGGRALYRGAPTGAAAHFEAMGLVRPQSRPVPDWVGQVAQAPHRFSGGGGDDNGDGEAAVACLDRLAAAVPDLERAAGKEHESESGGHHAYNTTLPQQMRLCLARQVKVRGRNRPVTVGGFVRSVFVALVVGSTFFQLGFDEEDARSRVSLLFFVGMFASMPAVQVLPFISGQRDVFYFQRRTGVHGTLPYIFSMVTTTVPFVMLETLLFASTAYPLIGLRGGVYGAQFWYFYVVMLLCSLTARSVVFLVSFASPNAAIGGAVAPLVIVMSGIFAGFLIPVDDMPAGWSWLYHVSYLAYAYRGLLVSELNGVAYGCGADSLVPPATVPDFDLAPPDGFGGAQVCRVSTGDDMLAIYGLDTDEPDAVKARMVLALLGFYLAFTFAAAVVLRLVNWSAISGTSDTAMAESRRRAAEALEEQLHADEALASLDAKRAAAGASVEVQMEALPQKSKAAAAAAAAAEAPPPDKKKPTSGTLAFDCLSYEVDAPKDAGGVREILTGVYGAVRPGEMLVLMGSTGAGKSTALDVVTRRKTGGRAFGAVAVDGRPRDESFAPAYCEQNDSHTPTSTVREAVELSARLRLPRDTPEHELQGRVDRVLADLGLTQRAGDRLGTPGAGDGVPPAVRKKVTVGVELVAMRGSSILFLDEPTTGLDAASALDVCATLRALASGGASIVCTLHQPSAEVFALFDTLLLLVTAPLPGGGRSGRVAYLGPCSQVALYFESVGMGAPDEGVPVADFVLQALDARRESGAAPPPHELFAASPEGARARATVEAALGGAEAAAEARERAGRREQMADQHAGGASGGPHPAAPWARQTAVLAWRFVLADLRSPSEVGVRLAASAFMAVVLGTLWWQSPDTLTGAQNRVGLIFFATVFTIFFSQQIIPRVCAAKATFFRERTSGAYSVTAYFVARLAAGVPVLALQALVFCAPAYFFAGLRPGGFGLFVLVIFLSFVLGVSWSELMATVTPTPELALGASTGLLVLSLLQAGFVIVFSEIPFVWRFFYYFNLLRYQLFIAVTEELDGLALDCAADEVLLVPVSNGTTSCDPVADADNLLCFRPVCALPTGSGNDILDDFSMDPDEVGIYFVGFFGMMLGVISVSLLALARCRHVKR